MSSFDGFYLHFCLENSAVFICFHFFLHIWIRRWKKKTKHSKNVPHVMRIVHSDRRSFKFVAYLHLFFFIRLKTIKILRASKCVNIKHTFDIEILHRIFILMVFGVFSKAYNLASWRFSAFRLNSPIEIYLHCQQIGL